MVCLLDVHWTPFWEPSLPWRGNCMFWVCPWTTFSPPLLKEVKLTEQRRSCNGSGHQDGLWWIPKTIRTFLIEIIKALHGPVFLSVPTLQETNYCFPYVSHSETKKSVFRLAWRLVSACWHFRFWSQCGSYNFPLKSDCWFRIIKKNSVVWALDFHWERPSLDRLLDPE